LQICRWDVDRQIPHVLEVISLYVLLLLSMPPSPLYAFRSSSSLALVNPPRPCGSRGHGQWSVLFVRRWGAAGIIHVAVGDSVSTLIVVGAVVESMSLHLP